MDSVSVSSVLGFVLPAILGLVALFIILKTARYRRVVPADMQHIVQSQGSDKVYGSGAPDGNAYYAWPSHFPRIGVMVREISVSNFDIMLNDYVAYDKDRVPFAVDVAAFFRISDARKAAQRTTDYDEMKRQLTLTVQGAVRKVLASYDINQIMVDRAVFGEQFTAEVSKELEEWGVDAVKSMELMDIRDAEGSMVIQNIMAKKSSFIETDSRIEVAENKRQADLKEIEATQEVDIRRQLAEQSVGESMAKKDQAVGIANEQSQQEILTQKKVTEQRDMDVRQVGIINMAKIEQEKAVVAAQQEKETQILRAQGELEASKLRSEAIKAEGQAQADAAKQMQLASVEAQVTLADKIGENPGYQNYLVASEQIKANQAVGMENAKALQSADIKVIANAANPGVGLTNIMEMFSSNGGTQMAAALEGFVLSEEGRRIVDQLTGKTEQVDSVE